MVYNIDNPQLEEKFLNFVKMVEQEDLKIESLPILEIFTLWHFQLDKIIKKYNKSYQKIISESKKGTFQDLLAHKNLDNEMPHHLFEYWKTSTCLTFEFYEKKVKNNLNENLQAYFYKHCSLYEKSKSKFIENHLAS